MLTRGSTRKRAVWYPESDDRGAHEIKRLISEVLRPLMDRFLVEKRRPAHVGANQFIYWEEGNPTRRVAPDVYVLPGIDRSIAIPSWKTWETGIVPSLAIEVAGDDIVASYEDRPVEYARLGVDELVVFDPDATPTSKTRVRWQVFRHFGKRGLVRVDVSQSDRVRSKVLKAWLRAVGSGDAVRIRIAEGDNGDVLFPTEVEAIRGAKEAEPSAKDAYRDTIQALREATDLERRACVAAEEEAARLRQVLERMKRSGH